MIRNNANRTYFADDKISLKSTTDVESLNVLVACDKHFKFGFQ